MNKTVSADKKIKFVGFDIQVNQTGETKLLEYLKRVAPERVAETETLFKTDFDEAANRAFYNKNDQAALAAVLELKRKYSDLFVFLELNETNLVAESSRAEYEQMRETARVLAQFTDSYSRTDISSSATRDLYMADNLRRIAIREPAGTKFVIWAHNGHIQTSDSDGYQTFGYHLRRFYGKDYYALGFSFNQGAFQARGDVPDEPKDFKLREWTVKPAPEDSIEWYAAQTGVKSFIIAFRRRAAVKNEISEWLVTPRPFRIIGSGFAPQSELRPYPPKAMIKEYDGLFFIDTTTRARPNPSVKNVAPTK